MSEKPIDLRSDTVTRPTPGMRAAMAEAVVGDDVFGEDPTVSALEDRVAALLGKERAIFVPSGTMSNQIGLRLHCVPGDEVICEADCHVYNYEQAGYAQLSGLAVRPVAGDEAVLQREQIEGLIRAENDHLPRTRLLCLENTHNRGAGRVLPYDGIVDLCDWAHAIGLATHLDGARLWNAAVATGIPPADWSRHFDTVSVCFSKGLGAPVGSALAGPRGLIKLARRHRKLLGGGMRQAGVLAAAALYALEHQFDRLAVDHAHAAWLAAAIARIDGLELCPARVETNIVIFRIDPRLATAAEFCAALKDRGLLVLPIGQRLVRAVTHLDVDGDAVRAAGAIVESTADQLRANVGSRR
ncbi:MAG TPA: GntG family PLP-dependent aldolase [Pirellulales bacterium]|jgi:threonine aldolase|nr:GntG family PLP-dependent aldolase [Pirellulales bacterium]